MEFLLYFFALIAIAALLRGVLVNHREPLDTTPEQVLLDADAMCRYGHHKQALELLSLYCQHFPDNQLLNEKRIAVIEAMKKPLKPSPSGVATNK